MGKGTPQLAVKVRELRRREGLTQARMAERLGISASYMNLIENARRPLTAPLLIKLAQVFDVDLQQFAEDDSEQLRADLMESFADPLFDALDLRARDVDEMAANHPSIARAILSLYQAFRGARESSDDLRTLLDGAPGERDSTAMPPVEAAAELSPAEEVSAFLQRKLNHFSELEGAAETLWKVRRLDLQSLHRGLSRHLMEAEGVLVKVVPGQRVGPGMVRKYDPKRRRLLLSEVLPPRSRNFQLAHQIALLSHDALLDDLVADGRLVNPSSRALARIVLANYFAGAVLMPYADFLTAAREVRYDVEMLGHRFRTSFEQVCHRLTTLRRPGAEAIPFHMVRVDIAGNISKRFSASGIRFARFSGACPRWNVYRSFLTPGMLRTQISEMPDGQSYFCVARTVRRKAGGYHQPSQLHAIGLGCRLEHAGELVYSDGVDLESRAVPIGTSCRVCPRQDCDQRAFPTVLQPLDLDENTRGRSVYTPTGES